MFRWETDLLKLLWSVNICVLRDDELLFFPLFVAETAAFEEVFLLLLRGSRLREAPLEPRTAWLTSGSCGVCFFFCEPELSVTLPSPAALYYGFEA